MAGAPGRVSEQAGGTLTLQAWLTVAVLAGTLVLLVRDRHSPALVVFGATVMLMLLGVTSPEGALSGFANPAPFTVAALYVVARSVEKTGALQPLLGRTLGSGYGWRVGLARLLAPVAAASSFLNNTPIVAMVSPQVSDWAERTGRPASWYLMPLSFAAILGGTVTVIGTSTTIVVSGLMQSHGMEPLAFFEVTPLGLPLAVAGLALLVLVAPILIPDRQAARKRFEEEAREFTVQVVVRPDGPLDGVTVEEGGLRHLQGVFLVEIHREQEGELVAPARPDTVLHGGDRLLFAGRADQVVDLEGMPGLDSAARKYTVDFHEAGHTYFEAVVGAGSPLRGRTLKEAHFRGRYGAAVLAIHRSGERIQGKLGEVVLRHGDTLLLLADRSFEEVWRDRPDFLLVAHLGGLAPATTRQSWIVAGVLAGVVGTATAGLLPILHASLLAAFVLMLLRVLTPAEAAAAVDMEVIILIAGAFGLGAAVESSGLDDVLAQGILGGFGGFGERGALLGIVLATLILTELVTNNAAAILLFPIALGTAAELGMDPRGFAVAVAITASGSFLTPIGYQTNTMVYGPGGYRFGDYARLGFPLSLLVIGMVVGLVPLIW